MPIKDVTEHALAQLVSLDGRRAVVTGGAMGIGRAIAVRLAEAGADVVVADLDLEAAELSAKEIGDAFAGRRVVARRVDVSDPADVSALVHFTVETLGDVDIWVNNAGIYPAAPLLEMTDDVWDRVLDVNLRGSFDGAREAARHMVDAGHGGVIVNIASTAGFTASGPGVAHYVSSKHGVNGLTKALAIELAPYGIRCLAVAPTLIETPGIDANRARFEEAGLGDALEQLASGLPLGRMGVPDDVARVVLFCASDLSLFMTGSTLLVDAGDVAR
jgi:NAD(P)-dependent dehydrogenase (short-subunit alcohol dehydrogenase family)